MIDFVKCQSYEEMSQLCAKELVLLVKSNPKAKIILATGASPLLAYRLFVKEIIKDQINVSEVTWIKLDEWAGLTFENPATCEYYIRREILDPLHVQQEKYISFGVCGNDLEEECTRIEKRLKELGRIDAAVVGIGRNGHIGLNEPADELCVGIHTVKLDAMTKKHSMLKDTNEVEYGITLGIDNILSSVRVIVLATGEGKSDVYKKMLEKKVLTEVPATFMHLHSNLCCYKDEASIGE